MIKPGHMRMPRGKGGQVDPSIKSSVKRVTGTGLNSDSVHTGKASGGGGGGWVAAGWLRSPGMGLGSGMVVILSWPLDRFPPSDQTQTHHHTLLVLLLLLLPLFLL